MWGAVVLASIFEFVGAISLGGSVSSTIKGGIADPTFFADRPYVRAPSQNLAGWPAPR